MTYRRLILAAGLLAALPGWVSAQGNGNGHGGGGNGRGGGGGNGQGGGGHGNRGQGGGHRGRGGPPSLGAPERQAVLGWYGSDPGWVPASLPPGQRRRLERGKPLPPGIARQALPPGLAGLLPAHPGHAYYAVGTDLVLVTIATGVIVSILAGGLAP